MSTRLFTEVLPPK